jgi:hypothetical protein
MKKLTPASAPTTTTPAEASAPAEPTPVSPANTGRVPVATDAPRQNAVDTTLPVWPKGDGE